MPSSVAAKQKKKKEEEDLKIEDFTPTDMDTAEEKEPVKPAPPPPAPISGMPGAVRYNLDSENHNLLA